MNVLGSASPRRRRPALLKEKSDVFPSDRLCFPLSLIRRRQQLVLRTVKDRRSILKS